MNYQQKIEDLLNIPNLPHKLKVRFALYCAEDVRHLLTDERSIKALDITKLWLEGKASQKEIEDASNAASYASNTAFNASSSSNAASYAASNASYAAYASTAAYAASTAAYAASAAASNATPSSALKDKQKYLKIYYTKLLEMIDNLTELEKAIWDIKKI